MFLCQFCKYMAEMLHLTVYHTPRKNLGAQHLKKANYAIYNRVVACRKIIGVSKLLLPKTQARGVLLSHLHEHALYFWDNEKCNAISNVYVWMNAFYSTKHRWVCELAGSKVGCTVGFRLSVDVNSLLSWRECSKTWLSPTQPWKSSSHT